MPVVQVILNPRDYDMIRKVKLKHKHTWVDCVKIYADIYSHIEPKKRGCADIYSKLDPEPKPKEDQKAGLKEL